MKFAETKNKNVYIGNPKEKPDEKKKYVAFIDLKNLREHGDSGEVIVKRLPKSHFLENRNMLVLSMSPTRSGLKIPEKWL